MNYEAWLGYWFYNGDNAAATAALYASYGLLETAPEATETIYQTVFDAVKFIVLGPWAAFKRVAV